MLANRQALEWVSHRLHRTICRTVRRAFEDNDLTIVYEIESSTKPVPFG